MNQQLTGATGVAFAESAEKHKAVERAPIWKLIPLWLIVALLVSSPVIGASVINNHMAVALKMDRAQLGAGFSLFVAVMSLSAPLTALGFRYFGVQKVALAGAALAAVGAVLMATSVQSATAFVITYGLIVGLGVGASGVLPVQTVVANWFPHRRALAVCIILSAIDISGIIAAPAFDKLIGVTGSWQNAWWVTLGAIVAAGFLILWIIPARLSVDPHQMDVSTPAVEMPAKPSRVYKSPVSWDVKEAVRTRQFYLLMFYSLGTAIIWVFFLSHGVNHLQEVGFSPAMAASTISMVVGAQLLGNLVAGLLGDRVPPHLIGAFAMLLMGIGLAMGLSPANQSMLIAFAVVFGFGYGSGQVCWITTLANYFGPKSFPILYGLILATGSIGGAIGGVGAGAVHDNVGSYSPALLTGIALACVIGLLQFLASPGSIRREKKS